MDTNIQTIPQMRKVYYATYANLPTTGLKVGDLGYATDRLVFYRWSGAAWEALTIHSSSGVAANIPTAANLPDGSLYYETDTTKLKQVQSSAWVEVTKLAWAASDITSGRFILARLPTLTTDKIWKGVAGVPAETDLPTVAYGRLAAGSFRVVPGTGTTDHPDRLNNNDTGSPDTTSVQSQYADILFPAALKITQFRHFGNATLTGDGTWELQYMNAAGTWVSWKTGISTRNTADWSNWDSSAGEVVALAIRLIATTLDSLTQNIIGELEVKY